MDQPAFTLDSKVVGALPIVNALLQRLDFAALLDRHLGPPDSRAKMTPASALHVLTRNLILARLPLYAVREWARQVAPDLLGLENGSVQDLGDDRLGRALDRLFDADRNAFLTEFVLHLIREFSIDLGEFHNDSTSITLQGEYAEADGRRVRGKPTCLAIRGFNKDHRPDLKQLLWILTVSADGAVPVLFKVTDGNTEDSTTHRETWMTLRRLVGSPDFLYVADSKLCTGDNLQFIHSQSGSFVTVLPQSRKEDRVFKDWLQTHPAGWSEIARRPNPVRKDGPWEIISALESPFPDANGFRLIWYHSSLKRERDAQARQAVINRAWKELEALAGVLEGPRCRYKQREGVAKKAEEALRQAGAARWLHYEVEPLEEHAYRQERRGRPGSAMRWRRETKTRFRLVWRPIPETIEYDQRIDGIFPLVTNRQDLSPLGIHDIFKSKQPLVEKRHDMLKNVLSATPAFLKSVSRLEALLFLVYVSLTVHALIEREVRKRMKERGEESLPLYPEERECRAPTARRILEVFSDLQRHFLLQEGQIVQKFKPELNPLQKRVLSCLGVPEKGYGDPRPS